MKHSRSLIALAFALTLTLPGCAAREETDENAPVPPPVLLPLVLHVENRNWQEIVIYAMVGGTRHRIGSVPAVKTTTLQLPKGAVQIPGNVQLVLDPLGSRATYRTGTIMVGFGQEIQLRIENELKLTSWSLTTS